MIKELKKDNLKVKIYENRLEMGREASKNVADQIKIYLMKQEFINIVFASAPSQEEFLNCLLLEDIEWERINAFHMDEYLGLEEGSPELFKSFLKEKIFDKVSFREIFYIESNSDNECNRYSELIKNYPPDIVCMGIGENNHIAFNDPHVANFVDPYLVKIVDLDDTSRQQQVNDGCFKNLTEVPQYALTLTVPALFNAKSIFCIVPGENKAQAVYHTLQGSVEETYPSTILRKHNNAILYLEKKSANLIDY